MRGPQGTEHEAGRGYGGRSLFTIVQFFSSGSAFALTARRWSAVSCELLFCDRACSASAELRNLAVGRVVFTRNAEPIDWSQIELRLHDISISTRFPHPSIEPFVALANEPPVTAPGDSVESLSSRHDIFRPAIVASVSSH